MIVIVAASVVGSSCGADNLQRLRLCCCAATVVLLLSLLAEPPRSTDNTSSVVVVVVVVVVGLKPPRRRCAELPPVASVALSAELAKQPTLCWLFIG